MAVHGEVTIASVMVGVVLLMLLLVDWSESGWWVYGKDHFGIAAVSRVRLVVAYFDARIFRRDGRFRRDGGAI